MRGGETLAPAWWRTVPEARQTKARFTITAEQEAKALAEWKTRR